MAKQHTTKGGTSRIRFIMIDAEIPEGDLNQITAAIQNALKPNTTIIQQRLPSSTVMPRIGANDAQVEFSEEEDLEIEADEIPAPKPPKSARARKPATPEVLEFDFTSDVSLKSFAEQHSAENEPERCLVIAAWFKEHRSTPSVTTSHVYTGYRVAEWPAGLEDFGWPLRHLKKDKLMSSSARGSFDTNHIGLEKVRKLRTSV